MFFLFFSVVSALNINTTLGPVFGTIEKGSNGDEVGVWRGIPFAADTSGENRFKAPQPRKPWTDPLNATINAAGCRQPHHNADVPCDGKEGPRCQSEDCLNVNVFCPTGTPPSEGYPTMFWIYGGAFDEGVNYGPLGLYDGTEIASRGKVCVVATNYRLGVLGYLVTSEQKGNQGFLDQRMAMQWTRDNIKNFGGNPNMVTLWGESAGAMSVGLHMISPGSAGLFHRAIMESNPAGFRYQQHSHQHLTFAASFFKYAGCKQDNMTCIRAVDVHKVVQAGEKAGGDFLTGFLERIIEGGYIEDAFAMEWSPVVDGKEIPGLPLDFFASGKFNKVPTLIGTNQDEGATFVYAGVDFWLPEFLFPYTMDGIFGDKGDKVVSFYQNAAKQGGWKDTRDSLSYVLTDFWFKCASERIARAVAESGLDTYVYRFQHVLSFSSVFKEFGLPTVCENRTCHATELFFAFDQSGNFSFTKDEQAMSDDFISYWTAFARTGDVNSAGPAGKGTTFWPKFNATDRLNLRMAVPRSVESTKTGQPGALPSNGVCDWFDNIIGYNH